MLSQGAATAFPLEGKVVAKQPDEVAPFASKIYLTEAESLIF